MLVHRFQSGACIDWVTKGAIIEHGFTAEITDDNHSRMNTDTGSAQRDALFLHIFRKFTGKCVQCNSAGNGPGSMIFLYDRRRLGVLSRVAVRSLRTYVQAAVGERKAVPGVIVCVQTFGSVAHLYPHLHVLLTDGALRRNGTFVPLPEPDAAVLEELWRRSVLAEFVRRGWLEEDAAAGMMSWPHSGFGAYIGPRIEEREGLLRVARYSARAPVAEARLRHDAERAEVELVSDRNEGPYAGAHRMTALEFIARWVDHVPERYEVRVRYAGAYATRRRVGWRRRGIVLARIIGFVTEPRVIRRILAHLARRGVDARAGPWAGAAAAPG